MTEASYLAEYMSQTKHSASNWKGMDTDEGEVACDRIGISVDDSAVVLQRVQSLLGLPALDGAINHVAEAEENCIKLRITMDHNGDKCHALAALQNNMYQAAQASKEEEEKDLL